MKIGALLRKIHKRIFERFIGRLFYQSSKDNLATVRFPSRLIRSTNQWFNENGFVAPWVYTKDECLEFWESITNDHLSVGNRPKLYAAKSDNFINFMDGFWSSFVNKDDRISELGCNCGANLNYLYQLG